MLSTSRPSRSTLLFEKTMNKNMTVEKRKTFRHADLRNALLTAGFETARVGGPGAVIVREATREASVSPNATYTHLANQAALLGAVRSVGLRAGAAAKEDETKNCRPRCDPHAFERKSLGAVGIGYPGFAIGEPGDVSHGFSRLQRRFILLIRPIRQQWTSNPFNFFRSNWIACKRAAC
jgi:hypothetical protein